MIVFGVTGHPSSGKDTVGEHLASLGFFHIATADLIRAEMRERGIPVDRAHTSVFAIECRKERGSDYLALISAKKIMDGNVSKSVVSGLRNTAEVEALKKAFGKNFVMIAVEAPIETRYSWVVGRKREGDSISFEQFKAEEEKERSGDKNTHQVDAVIAMADKVILNNGTRDEFLKKVESLVKDLV
ncbi:MAG TPA: AAA family ATPase [Candidatus Paceibacterota bacterium]